MNLKVVDNYKGEGCCLQEAGVGEPSGHFEKAESRGPPDQSGKALGNRENQAAPGTLVIHGMTLVFVAGPPYNMS